VSASFRNRDASPSPSPPAAELEREPDGTRPFELGDVAFMKVTDLTSFGAFVDWGQPKELLVPFAEQICELRLGERYAIGVIRDPQGRFAGTQRVSEMLATLPQYTVGDWVPGEAWRKDSKLGIFVILNRRYVGLLPSEEPNDLQRGTAARFRVSQVLPDGKVRLSLRGSAFDELEDDAQRVLARLRRGDARVSDQTDPEIIRQLFGLSKKAFKRAVGRLLKQGLVRFGAEGNVCVQDQTPAAPTKSVR
jgi:predicted RNA-binding protein (virulence factor B family)